MIEPRTQREKDCYTRGYQEAEKAYGACHLCYGKGYSTVKSFLGGRHFLVTNDPYEPCPKCDRGKQIGELIAKERAEGERREQKLLDALESMYEQYCPNGHLFMGAGESASSVMEEYGYSFDGAGRLESYPTLPADSTEV